MPASKYRNVYAALGGGWFAKAYGTYIGHAATEKAAAKLFAEHTGTKPMLKVMKEHRSKVFKGVCYHKTNKSYVAQTEGKTIGGCYKTAEEAAAALKKYMKLGAKDNTLKRKANIPPAPFRERFRVLQKLFCKKGNPILPGDLEVGLRQYKTKVVLRAFDKEPFLEDLCLLAKYGPIKEHMVKEWRNLGCRGAKEHSMKEREEHCYKVLERTAQHFSGKALPEWVENCGRNVSHHSSFVPLLHRLGIVQSKKPREATKLDQLDMKGVGGSCVKYFTGAKKARKKLRDFIGVADAVSALPVPTSGAEWLKSMNIIGSGKGPKKYLKKWHLRSRWLLRRKALLGVGSK